jgi:hypothetical protein
VSWCGSPGIPGCGCSDIAAACLLTERAVQRVITDLEEGECLTHTRVGHHNRYHVSIATLRTGRRRANHQR